MKGSVAKKVVIRIFLAIIVILITLCSIMYLFVSDIVLSDTAESTRSVAIMLSNFFENLSYLMEVPIDESFSLDFSFYMEKLCGGHDFDYTYMFIPDIENGRITYISLMAFNDKNAEKGNTIVTKGTIDYALTPSELAVWNGTQKYAVETMRNSYGNEQEVIVRITDAYGNKSLLGLDRSLDEIQSKIRSMFLWFTLATIISFAGITVMTIFIVRKRISIPARNISKKMSDFVKNGMHSPEKLPVNGNDEFSEISRSFNSMTDDIEIYLSDISALTQEKATRAAEMNIAAKIQKGFLPEENFHGSGYLVHAMMVPASDVGGDMYDYFKIDGDNTLLIVADVSGKGITASIFMSVTLALMHQNAKIGLPPAEILRKTNEAITEKNPLMLFCTAFVGIYNRKTNTLSYANAGHNVPYVIGKKFIRLDEVSGTVLGLFDDETYEEASIRLGNGDIFFAYTDGVNEATDEQNKFFGTERLEAILREYRSSDSTSITQYVYDAVKSFSGNAPQSDDITMLSITPEESTELLLDVDESEFAKIKSVIMNSTVPQKLKLRLCLAMEELFVNICSYAYEGGVPEGEKVRFSFDYSDKIFLRLEDGGSPHNPLENIIDIDDYDFDTAIGGLGKFISLSITDGAHYEYINGKNVITITKNISEEDYADN